MKKMLEGTRKALIGSIEKWEGVLNGTITDQGTKNCPLCHRHIAKGHGCGGCPVKEHTGKMWCYGSPYYDFVNASDRGQVYKTMDNGMPKTRKGVYVLAKKGKKLAYRELDFLQNLLPEE